MSERKGGGCLIAGIPILLIGGIGVIVFLGLFGPKVITELSLANIAHPDRFAPSEQLKRAAAMAGPGLRYYQTTALGVRPDGTIDLTAKYAPTASYQWYKEGAAQEAQPIGVPGGQKVQLVTINVEAPGWKVASQSAGKTSWRWSRGMSRYELEFPKMPNMGEGVALPTCDLKALWAEALAAGAPKNAVASIRHDQRGYAFNIEGTPHSYNFGQDCKRLP